MSPLSSPQHLTQLPAAQCIPGKYWSPRKTCALCPKGKYRNGYGSECFGCPIGKFQLSYGQEKCKIGTLAPTSQPTQAPTQAPTASPSWKNECHQSLHKSCQKQLTGSSLTDYLHDCKKCLHGLFDKGLIESTCPQSTYAMLVSSFCLGNTLAPVNPPTQSPTHAPNNPMKEKPGGYANAIAEFKEAQEQKSAVQTGTQCKAGVV